MPLLPPRKQRTRNTTSSSQQRLSEAFVRYQSALKTYLGKFLKNQDDVDDILQDTFFKTFRAAAGKIIDNPGAFLFRTAHNLALNDIRNKVSRATDSVEDFDTLGVTNHGPTLEQRVMASEEFALLCEAVDALPPQCKRVFVLRKVYGLSHKEIASELGIAVSTIEKHIAKGVLASRDFLAERKKINSKNEPSAHLHKFRKK
ncbi:MAG: RNA polymerase sigma factor [Porticoccaceae bacterium]|nr:RNA polymerase sigma factor [Porticoccaceae bacterium]